MEHRATHRGQRDQRAEAALNLWDFPEVPARSPLRNSGPGTQHCGPQNSGPREASEHWRRAGPGGDPLAGHLYSRNAPLGWPDHVWVLPRLFPHAVPKGLGERCRRVGTGIRWLVWYLSQELLNAGHAPPSKTKPTATASPARHYSSTSLQVRSRADSAPWPRGGCSKSASLTMEARTMSGGPPLQFGGR